MLKKGLHCKPTKERVENRVSQSKVHQGKRSTVKVKCCRSVNVSVQWWQYSNGERSKLVNGGLLAQLPALIGDIGV